MLTLADIARGEFDWKRPGDSRWPLADEKRPEHGSFISGHILEAYVSNYIDHRDGPEGICIVIVRDHNGDIFKLAARQKHLTKDGMPPLLFFPKAKEQELFSGINTVKNCLPFTAYISYDLEPGAGIFNGCLFPLARKYGGKDHTLADTSWGQHAFMSNIMITGPGETLQIQGSANAPAKPTPQLRHIVWGWVKQIL